MCRRICDVDAERFTSPVKTSIKKMFVLRIGSDDEDERHHVLMNLFQHLKKASERKSTIMAWGTEAFLQGVVADILENIVNVAIRDGERSAQEEALQILEKFVRDEGTAPASDVIALKWLEEAGSSQSWRTRNNAVLVSEMFAKQTDNVGLFQKLLAWAWQDQNINVRRSSLKLTLSICKESKVQVLPALKTTIASPHVAKALVREPLFIRTDWISLLKVSIKFHSLFANAVKLMLELGAVDARFDTLRFHLPEGQSDDVLLLEECAEDLHYGEAVKGALKKILSLITPLENHDQLRKLSKLVEFLFALSRTPNLQNIAEDALKNILAVIQNSIWCEPVQAGDTSELPQKASIGAPSRENSPPERSGWIYLASTLAAAGYVAVLPEFELAAIIFRIAVDDDDDGVHLACLRSLVMLAESRNCKSHLKASIARNIDIFVDDTKNISEVRIAYIQLLSRLGIRQQGAFPQEVVERVTQLALSDRDQDVRLEALNAVSYLTQKTKGDLPLIRNFPDRKEIDLGSFEDGILDPDWRVRQAWIKFAGTQIPDANSPYLSSLLSKSIIDAESRVRKQVVQVLQPLMLSEDAGDMEHIAAKLSAVLGSRLAAPDSAACALSALATITETTIEDSEEILCQGPDMIWLDLILLLDPISSEEFPISRKIIQTVIQEKTKEALDLLYKSQLPEPMEKFIPKAVSLALDFTLADKKPHICIATIRLFSHLKGLRCSKDCKWEENSKSQEGLESAIDDEKVVSQLANLAIKSRSKDLRQHALRLLKEAFVATDRLSHLRRPIKASLQDVIEHSLKDRNLRPNALDVIDDLTSDSEIDQFRQLFQPSIPYLLTALLIDREDNLHESVENVLFKSNRSLSTELRFNRDVIKSIPPLIAEISTLAGKSAALRLVSGLPITDDVAESIASSLASLLRHIASPFAGTISLELLLSLYKKHGSIESLGVHSAIPGIVALALDDDGETWVPAMKLLLVLSSRSTQPNEDGTHEDDQNSALNDTKPTTYNLVLSQVESQMPKFMVSLEREECMPMVVELLSLVACDTKVRRSISLSIATRMFEEASTNLPEGHARLLGRLISHGRLQDQATDFMMLLVAHTIVSTNQTQKQKQHRDEILTALWCRYGTKNLSRKSSSDLAEWFTFALFGRHATQYEVKVWNKRCRSWLGASPKIETGVRGSEKGPREEDEKLVDSPIQDSH
ncbi:hypothetical protein MD484_g3463, partial [Candolleomyces efflorescens]